MHIRHIPYIPWLPLLALVLAVPALADDGPAAQQQIVAELQDVAAFERRVERALEEDVERAMSAIIALEFERQTEHLARRYRFGPRNSVPASPAPR